MHHNGLNQFEFLFSLSSFETSSGVIAAVADRDEPFGAETFCEFHPTELTHGLVGFARKHGASAGGLQKSGQIIRHSQVHIRLTHAGGTCYALLFAPKLRVNREFFSEQDAACNRFKRYEPHIRRVKDLNALGHISRPREYNQGVASLVHADFITRSREIS